MKRITVLLLLLLLLPCLALPALAANVQLSNQPLTVDGQSRSCDYYNIDGSNYFKLRDIALLLSGTGSTFSVTYDEKTTVIRVTSGEAYVPVGGELETGKDRSSTAVPSVQPLVIDGVERSDLKAYNIGGNNYFQLRDLGKALNFGVNYDEASGTVRIESAKEHGPVTGRLGKTEDAGREYLDRIIFLGDSTTYGIGYYYRHGYTDLVPTSQIWTPRDGTMTLQGWKNFKIVYPPTKEEIGILAAAERAKPDILIITLGVSGGVSTLNEESFKERYRSLVQGIQEVSPETNIILNSIYPVADSYALQSAINNKKITAANGWIEELAEELGVHFLYSFEALEVDGKLPESSQNGDGLHLTGEAFGKVMEYIRTHALEG